MKKLVLLTIIFLGLLFSANGQFRVSYILGSARLADADSNMGNKIGFGYDLNKVFTVDAYFYSSLDYFEEFSPEITIRANFFSRNNYKLYTGAGMFVGWRMSLVFPVGVEIKPFSAYPKLSFRFDANTVIGLDINPTYFIPGLGISYSFGK
jgi:hypothetical protein